MERRCASILLHTLAMGEHTGYHVDYIDQPIAGLARALTEGFAYQREPPAYRDQQPRGERNPAPATECVRQFSAESRSGG